MHLIKAEVSASALKHNVDVLRAGLTAGTKLCAVVKSNAYGHRLGMVAPIIAEKADWLAVVSPAEALIVRDTGYAGPLLMLFSPHAVAAAGDGQAALAEVLARDVSVTVTGEADLPLLASAAGAAGKSACVHIEVDTGMTRSGVPLQDAAGLIEQVESHSQLVYEGIFTHFAMASELDPSFTLKQYERFVNVTQATDPGHAVIRHCANSVATLEWPEMQMDMVRPGLSVYGYRASTRDFGADLRPALRVTSRLMQVREVEVGAAVGYGGTFTFKQAGRVGLVAAGYGDGYSRHLSNRGAVLGLRGQYVPVLGRVSMDQVSVDLTGLPEAVPGDEVELISPEPSAPNSVQALSELAGTTPYTIVCGLQEHRAEWLLVD